MSISDEAINWIEEFSTKVIFFRVTVLEDSVDIPLEVLPFSTISDFSYQARQFYDDSIIQFNYDDGSIDIHQSTEPVTFAVSGNIVADYFIGDGSQLTNLTGTGFADGYSLNSKGGIYNDVVFVDNIGNVGIHTITPNARMHVIGNVVFREYI